MKYFENQKGSLLIEILLVTFLFGVLATGFMSTILISSEASRQGIEYVIASGYIKEGIEAVRSIRDQDWGNITNGTHGLITSGSAYGFHDTSNVLNSRYTRTITLEDVYRTGSLIGDIAASGILDSNTKKVTVNVTWSILDGNTQNIDSVFYVMNWAEVSAWTQTLTAGFTAGFENSTTVTSSSDGEVQLADTDADWDDTQVHHTINLPGSGNWETTQYDEMFDMVFMLALNTAGNDFVAYDASNVTDSAPVSFGGYDVSDAYDFALANGHAFIATGDNSAEVEVIDLSTFSQAATINLTGDGDAYTVDTSGNTLVIGRVSSGDDEFWVYDVSDPTIPTLSVSTDVSTTFNDIVTDGTYAYASSSDDSSEIYSFRISDGTQLGTLDLSGSDNAHPLHLVGDKLYVGRDDGSNFDFALVDVSTPSSMSVSSSLELGETINDVDVDVDEAYAVLATDDNSEEIIVANLSTFTKETSVDTTGSDNAESVEVYGGHIYVGSASNTNDFMVIRVEPAAWTNLVSTATVDKSGNHDGTEVYVDGNYTYLTTLNNGSSSELWIYDTTTPSSPTYLGAFDVGANVNDIIVSENYAYLATANNFRELDVIDVTTKTSPTRIGSYNATGSADAYTLALDGSTIYLGREGSGSVDEFEIIETLNPGGWTNPTLTGSADKSGSHDVQEVYVSGSYAYLVTDSSTDELFIYDISTPSSPSLSGSFNVGSRVRDIYVSGNYAYLATDHDSRELDVIDVSTKSSPSRAGSLNLSGNEDAFSITGSGSSSASTVYIGRDSSGNDELYVIDVSTPSSPSLSGSVNHGGDINKIDISGNYVYAATDQNTYELAVFDVSTSSSPSLAGGLDLSGDADGEAVDVSGSTVVIGRASSGQPEVAVINVSTPTSPSLTGTGEIGATVRDMLISGTDVFLVNDLNDYEFQIWDISTPASPVQTTSYDLDADANGIYFDGTNAVIGTEHDSLELQILIEGAASHVPDKPVSSGSYNFGSDINDLVYSSNYVYAATDDDSKELVVFDVSTPASISEAATYDVSQTTNADAIAMSGSVVALGRRSNSSTSELFVFDVSTPTSPILSGDGEVTSNVTGLWMNDTDSVFMACENTGDEFQVWDITVPSSPSQIATYDLAAHANGVYSNGTNAFVATEHNSQELMIFEQGAGLSDYARAGSFSSQAYDSGSAFTSWDTIDWTESGTGDIEFRIRTADTEVNLGTAIWVGSDGTSGTTYSTSGESITVDTNASGTQWIEYKAYLSGDTSSTPVLEDVTINYSQ